MSDSETALVAELRAMSNEREGSSFTITYGGQMFRVVYSGGSSSSLTFTARYDDGATRTVGSEVSAAAYRMAAKPLPLQAIRPMLIELRQEDSGDVAAKREGINVEHQTGDPLFDHHVYVDSPTTHAALLNHVLNEDVRRCVLDLLRLGMRNVRIDDSSGDVTTYMNSFSTGAEHDGRGAAMVAAFATILGALPVVRASGATHPRAPFAVFSMVGLGFTVFGFAVLLPVYLGNVAQERWPGVVAVVCCVVAGVLAAIWTRSVARRALWGRSDAVSQARQATTAALFLGGELLYIAIAMVQLVVGR